MIKEFSLRIVTINVNGWVRILLNESPIRWMILFSQIETFAKVPRALVIFVFVDFGVSSLLWTNRVGGDAVGSYRILSIVMRPDWPIRGRHCQFYWWPLGSREHSRIISFCVFAIFDDKTKTIFRESRLRRKKKKYGNWRGRVKKQVNLQKQKISKYGNCRTNVARVSKSTL